LSYKFGQTISFDSPRFLERLIIWDGGSRLLARSESKANALFLGLPGAQIIINAGFLVAQKQMDEEARHRTSEEFLPSGSMYTSIDRTVEKWYSAVRTHTHLFFL
jgi:hypothetical protein